MNTPPDSRPLLDEVLAESVAPTDSLGPLLGAVRARRRRRHYAPMMAAAATFALAWLWITAPSRDRIPGSRASNGTLASAPPPAGNEIERVHTRPLLPTEILSTDPNLTSLARVHSEAVVAGDVTDEELFRFAGGHGVGLLRWDGRSELLFASTDAGWP